MNTFSRGSLQDRDVGFAAVRNMWETKTTTPKATANVTEYQRHDSFSLQNRSFNIDAARNVYELGGTTNNHVVQMPSNVMSELGGPVQAEPVVSLVSSPAMPARGSVMYDTRGSVQAAPILSMSPSASYVMPGRGSVMAQPGAAVLASPIMSAVPSTTNVVMPTVAGGSVSLALGGSVQAAPAATNFVMPAAQVTTQAAPITTGLVTYSAPAAQNALQAVPMAGSVACSAAIPGSLTYPAAQPTPASFTYSAPPMTYAAAPAPTVYSAPTNERQLYTISPERFQRILAGEPLTNDEIVMMVGATPAAASTEIGSGPAELGGPVGAISPSVLSVASAPVASAQGSEMPPLADSGSKKKKKKDSSKASSKKKLASKTKGKGCC